MEPQKKIKQTWSIKLGLVQSVILLGIITGSMLCAFYLGLVSGQKAGFESAQANNLNSSVKLPIPDQYKEEELESVASNLYAKLNTVTESIKPKEFEAEEELPALAAIKTTKVVKPEIPALTEEEQSADKTDTEDKAENVITILSGKERERDNTVDQPTLGSLKAAKPVESEKEIDIAEVFADEESVPVPESSSVIETLGDEIEPPPAKARQNLEVVKEEILNEVKPPAIPKAAAEKPKIVEKPVAKKVDAQKTVPKVEEKSKPKITNFVKSNIPGGWYAQVAATGKVDDANNLAKKLRSSGFGVVIEKANIRGEEYYRVLVGPEEEKRYSETLVQQLKRESYLRGDPFIRRLK